MSLFHIPSVIVGDFAKHKFSSSSMLLFQQHPQIYTLVQISHLPSMINRNILLGQLCSTETWVVLFIWIQHSSLKCSLLLWLASVSYGSPVLDIRLPSHFPFLSVRRQSPPRCSEGLLEVVVPSRGWFSPSSLVFSRRPVRCQRSQVLGSIYVSCPSVFKVQDSCHGIGDFCPASYLFACCPVFQSYPQHCSLHMSLAHCDVIDRVFIATIKMIVRTRS